MICRHRAWATEGKQRPALQHHGKAVHGLAGFRVDGFVNQGMNELGVTVEIVQAGHGQAQCVGYQVVLAGAAQEPEHHRVIGEARPVSNMLRAK